MLAALTCRLLRETDLRLLARFAYHCGWRNLRAIQRFERRRRQGRVFPPFLFISLTNHCNLRCQGCWVRPTQPVGELAPAVVDAVIAAARREGSTFFGLLGGEPLLYPGLLPLLERHRDCYFQLFTNGTLLTAELARAFRRLGNVTPLISLEGDAAGSDPRRGGTGVYARTLEGLARAHEARLITGVATSVCRANLRALVNPAALDDLVARGAHYVWYYIYRPVGPDPAPELALNPDEILTLRRFLVDQRLRVPAVLVDAYWDHLGRALCPAAVGLSHHVSPAGDLEPCPPIQFAVDCVGDGHDLAARLTDSAFLARFRDLASQATRGCILLEQPQLLAAFLRREGARDSSGRGTAAAELAAMTPRPSHHVPGQEIPERSWCYRFAKKHWFFGFGAYG